MMSLPDVLHVGTPETSFTESTVLCGFLTAKRTAAGTRDLELEVERCSDDTREESAPFRLPRELRRPGIAFTVEIVVSLRGEIVD